jgi:hypothetical protein
LPADFQITRLLSFAGIARFNGLIWAVFHLLDRPGTGPQRIASGPNAGYRYIYMNMTYLELFRV